MEAPAASRVVHLVVLVASIVCRGAAVHAADVHGPANRSESGGRPYASLFPTAAIAVDSTVAAGSPAIDFIVQAASPPPPPPRHTGFGALIRSTGADFANFPRRRSTYVILAIGGAAAALVHPADDCINEELQESDGLRRALAPGRYLGSTYVQAGAAIGTYLIGRYAVKTGESKTNRVSHIGFDLLRAQVVAASLTYGVKVAVRRDRPTGECCSFPSGHASVTFATASVLERHFGYRGAWPTWVIAGYVAASRLTENRHFASDVLFGAALGVASGWTVVGRHGRDEFALVPVAMRHGAGFAFTWRPGTGSSGN